MVEKLSERIERILISRFNETPFAVAAACCSATVGWAEEVAALEAERDRLRSELQTVIGNVAEALFPNSPKDSAEAEFALDAMGACQVIRRLRSELEAALEVPIRFCAGPKEIVEAVPMVEDTTTKAPETLS